MAKRSLGTKIKINGTYVGGLVSIASPERTVETLDVTTLDEASGYKQSIGGFKDGGEVVITGFYDLAYTGISQIDTAYEASSEDTYIIEYPATIGATVTFTGLVTSLKSPGEANISDPLGFEATIKVLGAPVLATVASTGVSALEMVKTDGITALTASAILPAFVIGTFYYSNTFTTEVAFKPKVTATSHTIKLYVNGVFVENLTSGVAGSSISIGAAATKNLEIVVYEAAKTPKTYKVMVSRIS